MRSRRFHAHTTPTVVAQSNDSYNWHKASLLINPKALAHGALARARNNRQLTLPSHYINKAS